MGKLRFPWRYEENRFKYLRSLWHPQERFALQEKLIRHVRTPINSDLQEDIALSRNGAAENVQRILWPMSETIRDIGAKA